MSRPKIQSMDIESVRTISHSILDLGPKPLMDFHYRISSMIEGRYCLSLYEPALIVPIIVPVSFAFFPLDDVTVELAISNDRKQGDVVWVRHAGARALVVTIPRNIIRW